MRAVLLSHLYADPAERAKLRALADLGATVTATVPDRWVAGDGTLQATSASNDGGVTVVPIPVRGRLTDRDRLDWNAKALRMLVDQFRPDVIQVEEEPWTQPAGQTLRVAKKLGIPSVLCTAESVARTYGIGERLRRDRSLRLATGIIGTTKLALALATKRRPTVPRLALPQQGVTPPPAIAREPHPNLAIGFVGRLVPERGLDLLFRACVGLAGKWTLTVIGTGPSQEELEGLAQRLGIAARISWLGALPRKSVEEIWPKLDCVVLPSRTTERWVMTVGRAALHAMAHGVAVVGTDSGALPDLIGDAGRVVPEEDVPGLA
ncbi:MAG TPA: glycosyltransferase, partial [Gemmatimonadales bacterium]|nr:glycosyltransferase [Gemmatimonadales bacterium]